MRRSLGIAVFSGMLGVTLFGIFLTPVFYSVIQGLSETELFESQATRWVGSTLLTGLLGAGVGFLLARLGVARLYWALGVGGAVGVLAALTVLGIHLILSRAPTETGGHGGPPPSDRTWADDGAVAPLEPAHTRGGDPEP
jgi:multidrug efflux pump